MHPLGFCILFVALSQMRFFGCFAIRRTFCFLYSSVRVEQIYSLLKKSSEYISGIEGSSLKSHSRRVSLDTLAPSTPCFVEFASAKRLSTVLPRSPVGSTKEKQAPIGCLFFLFFGGVTELNPLAHRKAQKYHEAQNYILEKEKL